jgi:NAD(P)-dependent dehydrogenase (short-subunit alcohol dehydrogenase family)
MKPVCVITGGGSGMGLATAKILGRDYQIVICGRTLSKLERALAELAEIGIDAHSMECDVSDKESVRRLASSASQFGPIMIVINAAGISPQMGGAHEILKINALGAIHIHEAFFPHLVEGGCLIDIGSTGGYMVHPLILPSRAYRLSRTDSERFLKKVVARTRWIPSSIRSGFAYCISKNFLMWYVRLEAERFARKGVRVLSVSAGSFDTDMGVIAKAGADQLTQFCAIRRYGRVEEIAQLLAFCADKRLSYLTGVDILCDGGCLAGCLNNPIAFLRLQLKFLMNPA